jgi:hypothetical protein
MRSEALKLEIWPPDVCEFLFPHSSDINLQGEFTACVPALSPRLEK